MNNSPDKLKILVLNNIKHDLTNPVSAILGYSELLLDLIDINIPTLKDDINSIYEAGNSVLSAIKQLFSVEGIENINIENIIRNSEFQYSLRIPLTTIIGLTEFIIEDKIYTSSNECQDIEDSLKKIAEAGKSLLGQINDLKRSKDLTLDKLIDKYNVNRNPQDSSIDSLDFHNKIKIQNQIGTILLIDDEIDNIELLEKILQQNDHTIIRANGAQEALKILSHKSRHVDLILLDLIMPGMNGMELLQCIKGDDKTYNIPVIILSALDEMETIVECINMGADDFLLKPVNQVLLKARLNNALEKKYFRDKEYQYQEKIKMEQEKSESLLLNILPSSIAKRLKKGETLIADDINNATVLFADLSGFTTLSSSMSAKDLVMLLNTIFSVFDELLIKHSLEKIKTIGDNYMLAGGIPMPTKNHAVSVASMALDMLGALPMINKDTNNSFQIRIGINSGPVSAGVIGKKKFIYDLWGDTVNVASRMESTGINDKIHVSEATYKILQHVYTFEKCPKKDIPGKGIMQTYFLTGKH